MFSIEEEQLQLVDTTIFKRDRENIRYYKKLCTLELEWCQTNNEVICNKANVLYKKYLSNEPFAGRNRCLNFPKLEVECEKYNLKIKKGTNGTSLDTHYHSSSESRKSFKNNTFLLIGEDGKTIMLVNQNKDTYDRKTDEYIVAYIDLFGVTNKIKSKNSQLAMNKLHNLYTFSVKLTRDVQIEENQDIQFKIFSDNIIIAKKLSNQIPQRTQEIRSLLMCAGHFQELSAGDSWGGFYVEVFLLEAFQSVHNSRIFYVIMFYVILFPLKIIKSQSEFL